MGKQRTTENTEPTPSIGGGFSDLLKQHLDPLKPIVAEGFDQDRAKTDYSQTRNLDASKYRPYIKNLKLDDSDLDQQRAEGQSGLEQAGHALGQFGAQFLGGASMALGTSLDVEQSVNVVKGVEKEYSNMLFDFGKDLIAKGQKNLPIYQKNPGTVSPSDPGWWAQMFSDTGLSAGIMGESLLETAAVSALTEGMGLGAEISAAGKKIRNLAGMTALSEVGNTASKLKRSATLFGVINRHHEGIMEAADSFQTEYEDLKKKGLSEDDARNGAAKSASATYVGNLPLMALDIMQFRAMTFNPVSGASAGGLVEGLLGGVKNPKIAKAIGHGIGMLSEGGEEFWQALVQEEAKNYADSASGVGDNSSFGQRFKKLTDGGDIWNATISGIFGGALLGGATHLFEKATESGSRKQLNKEYDKFVSNISGIGSQMVNDIRTADEAGDTNKANTMRRSMGVQKALSAVHLDNLKDSDTAFSTYTSYMNNLLDAVNSNDTQQVESLGLTGQEQFVKDNVPNYLKDAQEIQGIYDTVKQTADRDAIIPITYRKFLQNNLASESQKVTSDIAALKLTMPDLSNVSSPGRAINEAATNVKLAETKIPFLKSQLAKEGLSAPERDGLNGQISNLNFLIEKNKQIIEEQKQVASELSESQKTTDEDILQSVNKNMQLQQLMSNKVDIDGQLAKVRKELNIWEDPKFQNKNRQQQLFQIVNEANSVDELTTAQKSIAGQGVLTDEIRSHIDAKRKELYAREEAKNLTNSNPIVSDPVEAPVESDVQESSAFSQELAKENGSTKIPEPTEVTPFQAPETAVPVTKSPERQQAAAALFVAGNPRNAQGTVIDPSKMTTSPAGNVITGEDFDSTQNTPNNETVSQPASVDQGAEKVFKDTPALSKLGTVAQYKAYLDTVFPDSKIKNVLYRMTDSNLEEFQPSDMTRGIYASASLNEVDQYKGRKREVESKVYSVLMNIQNPKEYRKRYSSSATQYTNLDEALSLGNDSLTVTGREGEVNEEVAVHNSDQVHILGSNKDIIGFQKWTESSLVNSEIASQATVIDADDWYEPAPLSANVSEEQKAGIKDRLSDYYTSLSAETGKKPTYKELVEDMINNTSAEAVDRNFNLVSLGWTLNDYPTTNFQKVYNELFGTRKSKANEFFTFAQESLSTDEEYRANTTEQSEKEELTQAPPTQIAETETGQKVFKSTSKFQTVESTLKLAHLSQTYNEDISVSPDAIVVERTTNSEELAQSQYVDSRELMNPNLYGQGTTLDVKIPENMDDIVVSKYTPDFLNKESVKFSEWAKGKDPESDEYIGRMPMIIYNADGKGVAFVHDIEWYNPINVGKGEEPALQQRIIAESRAELLAFRKAVINGEASKVTVTEKRPGTKIIIPSNKPLITVAEANPQAKIGFANDLGNIVVGDEVIPFSQLMNAAELDKGFKYDVRQSGLMPDGSKQYMASPVHYQNIDESAKTSIIQAIRAYMSQYDAEGRLSQKDEIEALRQRVKSGSKLDIFDQADLESYLGLFIQTYKGKAKTNLAIAEDINSRPEILNGTPYMAISEGRLVFGIKGVKLSQSESNGFTMYMHPQNFTKGNPAQVAAIAMTTMKRIFQGDYLGAMKQNLSQEHLIKDTPVTLLGAADQGQKAEKYQDHIKNKFKTNLRSIKLEDGTFTSFTQPVIHFAYENQPASITPDGAEIVKPVTPVTLIQQVASETTGNAVPAAGTTNEADLIKSIQAALGDFENLGLTPEAMQALKNLGTDDMTLFDPDYARLTDDIVKSIKTKLTKIEDLDTIDRNTVVQFIANQVMTKINPQERNTLSKKDLIKDINQSFNSIVAPKVAVVEAQLSKIQTLYDTGNYPNLGQVISQLQNLKANAMVLKKNWNFLINEAFEDYIEKFTGISVTMSKNQNTVDVAITDEEATQDLLTSEDDQQEYNVESNDQRDKDYSKESIEDNGKNSVSYLTKRFLAQIPSYDRTGNPKKGYMGITSYPGFDFYYDALGKILSSPIAVNSDINDILTRLEQHREGKPWVDEVMKRLSEADDQLKNAFMYNFSRETLSMKFVMYSFNQESNSYKLKVYDTNANEINRVIQSQWRENFKQSGLSMINGENYAINKDKAQQLLDKFNSWTAISLPSPEEAKTWLSEFGIELSTDAVKELHDKGYYVTENKKPVQYPYAKMFTKSASTNGVFGLLARKLEQMISASNTDFQINESINPYEDASGVLNKLANIESKYSLNVTTNSFRDGSKSIFGYTPGKFATSFVTQLKTDPTIIAAKRQISFDQNSYVMDLLENDPDFSAKFQIDHLGINAFKELGKKLYQDNTINSLADADHELVKLGMFQDTQQGEVKSTTPQGLKLRMARMFFPTMSDKSAMLDVATAVVELKNKDFIFNEDNSTTVDQNVKDFIFSQTIEPELKRIIAHHAKAAQLGVHPNGVNNQKGYNLGAQIFNMIPAMNNIVFKGAQGDVRLIEYLADSAGMINDTNYEGLKNNIKSQTNELIDTLVSDMINKKVASWEANGYFERTIAGGIGEVKYMNNSYMPKQGTAEEKLKTAAGDFVINSMITNANMHMLIIGDIANYSQDKAFKNNVEKDEQNNVLAYKPINNSVYANMSADIVGVNLGKRLALLVAPGATLAQSKNDKYVQLFLQDRVSVAENIDFLIELYHGKEALASVQTDLNTIRTSNNEKVNKSLISQVAKKFTDLGAYFDIESTDAQEYTTIKEHLDVLYRQGRISVDQYEDFKSKIDIQKKAEERGEIIPQDAILSDEKLKVIFQPIKPVYTGQMNDVANNVSRMMYIKSSSFPLLPQMTSAFPGLDSLRRKMEQLESKTGKNVRASYDTANKVGAVMGMNQIEVWDQQGGFNADAINVEDIATKLANGDDTSALILDRQFFRIQQDVPFKSTKIDHQDTITVGTQMMKLIFGDGVGQIKDKIFDMGGTKANGNQLQSHYNNMFDSWISSEKSKLYDSLGIDESTGLASDPMKTSQKLQNILQQEAKKRGYPKQDVEALELDANGQFMLPLWLSPNSNRYEAMLNAIVTNRLLNLKLPGASFVAGSEEGYKVSSDLTLVDQSKVIFTGAWTGELKGASNENLAQILVPSKFRDNNGKLLDLLQKKDGQFVYVNQADNGSYTLKADMVDKDLLSNPTFRIPTSSHVSLSQVEIVGFLPTESGDLMIVPKNFTKQKGLDFDVDKENMYMLHHTINENGKLVKIEDNDYGVTYANVAEEIKTSQDFLEHVRNSSAENKEMLQNYQDEIEVLESLDMTDFDRKHIKSLMNDAKHAVTLDRASIKSAVRVVKELKDLQGKLYQNEIVKAYSAVLSSKDNRIQEKINKVLSTDFAEEQANMIDSLIKQQVDNSNFTVLSDEYQKYKMSLGAAGKLGIGVYSNYVVLHSLIQQAPSPITLMEAKYMDGEKIMVPLNLNIGGIKFDGVLGKINTLDGGRSITDVNAERQNTATDNEKLQIMGKTNVNEVTINADALLSIMGYDKGSSKVNVNGTSMDVSIPYLIMSQPIMRDYVDAIRKTRSNIAGYNPDAEAGVLTDLITKYNQGSADLKESDTERLRAGMTGQKLVDAILNNGTDGESQQAVLELFLQLKDYGEQISSLQSKLNIQRSGLGKSIFEMIGKYNNVAKLENMSSIKNVDTLIGDFISGRDYYSHSRSELLDDGYTIFDDDKAAAPFAVRPTTVTGSLVVHSAKAGYELWADFFPHQNPVVTKTMADGIKALSQEEATETKQVQLQHEIFEEMKKYLFSSGQTGIFKGDPQIERNRLFFDREGNQSVAGFLKNFVKSDHENRDLVANNKLISRFQYTLEKGSMPSLIKYDNSKSEDFNEEYKYSALVELMDKNVPIGDYNGQPYTSRMLAKDLITYSYLQGGIQQAIEFVKYVPVGYLKEMGFADTTQMWQRAARGEMFVNSKGDTVDVWASMLGTNIQNEDSTAASRFVMQFLQHNAQRLPKLTEEQVENPTYNLSEKDSKPGLFTLASFSPKLNPEEVKPFISIYNKAIPKGRSKFQMYQFDGEKYNRVSSLGTFGLSEYDIRSNDVRPLIDSHFAQSIVAGKVTGVSNTSASTTPFGIEKNNLTQSLTEISEANIPGVSQISKVLLPYMDNSVEVKIGSVNGGRSRASYNNGIITLDEKYLSSSNTNKDMIAKTLLHEYIHSLTSKVINEHFTKDGVAINAVLPANMQRLQRLFNEVQKALGPELTQFRDWYTKNPGSIRTDSDKILYAGMNIHEFTAMIMSEPDVQRRMAEIPYMKTNKNMLQQFVEAIKKVLSDLGINLDQDNVTSEAMSTIFDILEDQRDAARNNPINNSSQMTTFGEVMAVTDQDLSDLLDQEDMKNETPSDEDFMEPASLQDELDKNCIF